VNIFWVYIGFAVVALLLVLLLARVVGNSQRRRIRKQLGLPINSRLSPKDTLAFRAFEDTDIKLKKSFPTMSDTQRQSMAREVLRDKGVIAKRNKPVSQS
jgi:Mg2+/citrate symporter